MIGCNTYQKVLTRVEIQQFVLARAFLGKPKILLLDEHTWGMNKEDEMKINSIIHRYSKATGATIIVTNTVGINTIIDSDKILIIKDGRLINEGNHQTLIVTDQIY